MAGPLRTVLVAAVLGIGLAPPCLAGDTVEHVLRVEQGRLVGTGEVLRVRRGATVVLRWEVDREMELHLHGYDVVAAAAPGRPGIMTVEARATGRFPVAIHRDGSHRHGREAALLYLEVHPR